jgi:deoxycytidylate deaminase
MHKHLESALELASNNCYDAHVDYHLSAIIVSGGSIISCGFNKGATNSFVEHYADRVRGKRNFCLSTHAEMDAVLKVRSKTDLTGCKIFVARKRKDNGLPGMAKPCPICEEVLLSYGIKRAYYTIDENNYGIMKISKAKGKFKDRIVPFNEV